MTDTTVSCFENTSLGVPHIAYRRLMRGAAAGFGAVATVGLTVISFTLVSAWIANTALSTNSGIYAGAPIRPRSFALADTTASQLADTPDANFEDRWARARVPASASASAVPLLSRQTYETAENIPLPPPRPAKQVAHFAGLAPVAKLITVADDVPLPRSHPATQEVGRSQIGLATPQVAAASPPQVTEQISSQMRGKLASLPAVERTAVYDIAAHAVYLPDGIKLEAHSGLGDQMDDPRYINVRMRGPTPPNVYDLTLREGSFHGVQAIRLNPVDDEKMFGRAGMLAHSYMLGENGQSNGCVSFKDYPKFLHAFLDGKIDRLVVVAHLGNAPAPLHVAHADMASAGLDGR